MKEKARLHAGDPSIRRLALNILQEYQVPSHYFVGEALAIGDYVKTNMRYVRDPENIEYLQSPLTMVNDLKAGRAQGDCDDMSLLTATLLLTVGIQPYFKAVRYEQSFGNFNHIYVVVYEKNHSGPKQRVVLDCILKNKPIGFELNSISGEEFPV